MKIYRRLWNHTKRSIIAVLAFAALVLLVLAAGCGGKEEEQVFAVYTAYGAGSTGNSYIAASAGEAAVIDTGTPDELLKMLKDHKLKLKYIILTHGHFDHIAGVDALRQKYPDAIVYINPADKAMLADPVKNLSARFGTKVSVKAGARPLTAETVLKLGRGQLEVITTPGHTPGSVSIKAGRLLFTGDTLFSESVGRTDFPGGNAQQLAGSLQKLMRLPDDTRIRAGHGDPTNLGAEKKSNPFLKGEEL